MADVDIDIDIDTGDSQSSINGVNQGLGTLEGAAGKAGGGLDTLSGAVSSVSSLMHAADQRSNDLARAHIAVERAADDLKQANRDLKQSQLDVNQAEIDGKQAGVDLKRATLEQATAKKELNKAIEEFGPNSTEAKTAALDLEDANIRVKQADQDVKQSAEDKKQAIQDGKTSMIDAKESAQDLKEANEGLAKVEGPEGSFMWIVQMGTDILGLVALFALLGGSALLSAASVALSWIIAFLPLILIGILIAAFVALVIIYWDEIKAALKKAWEWLKENVFAPIGRFFTETIPRWAGMVKDKIIQAWNAIKSGVKSAWDWVVQNVFNPIKNFFTQTIPGWANTVKNKIVGAWTTIRDRVKSLVGGVVNWARNKWNDMVSFFSGIPGRLARGAKGMWNFVSSGLKGALNAAIGLVNDGIFFINDKLIGNANRIPGVNIPFIPYIPFLADGGVTTGPTMAMIGEGREQEAVLPLSKLQGMMDMSGGRGGQVMVLELRGGSRAFREFFQESVRTTSGGDVIKYVEG